MTCTDTLNHMHGVVTSLSGVADPTQSSWADQMEDLDAITPGVCYRLECTHAHVYRVGTMGPLDTWHWGC